MKYVLDLMTLPEDISFDALCSYLEINGDEEPDSDFYNKVRQWIKEHQ